MTDTDKRRAIIILHPDFDHPETGLQSASDQAKQYVDGISAVVDGAKNEGLPEKDITELRRILSQFEVKIQVLPKELLTK